MIFKRNTIGAVILCMTLAFGCGKKDSNPQQIFAGTDSKTWKASKETNAQGDKDKLTESEEKESMLFYANGNFSMNGASASSQGKWTYEDATKNLSLQFTGTNTSENFQVMELDNDEIKLKAADGSTMVLTTE